MRVNLPAGAARIARRHPKIWSAYEQLGAACADAGPLDARTRRLVKLALAVASQSEGAVHSHTRRGTEEGLTREECLHVTLLAISVDWSGQGRGSHDVDRGFARQRQNGQGTLALRFAERIQRAAQCRSDNLRRVGANEQRPPVQDESGHARKPRAPRRLFLLRNLQGTFIALKER